MRWVVSSPNQLARRREEMASSCIIGGLGWILGKISLLKEWSGIGTGCPGKWWSHHPWRCSKMCRYGTLGHGLAGMVVFG